MHYIQYGTDPTYVNLSNNDSFTGTNVNSLTVPLSTPLQADTLYYYVVSSMGVRVQGTFHSGVYHLSYGIGDKAFGAQVSIRTCTGIPMEHYSPGIRVSLQLLFF